MRLDNNIILDILFNFLLKLIITNIIKYYKVYFSKGKHKYRLDRERDFPWKDLFIL